MIGEGAALAPELDDRNRLLIVTAPALVLGPAFAAALGAILLLDLPFDRQAVAVPARHVVGIEAEHLLRARHHVFEDFVERGADVDVAVGIGRPVVKDEAWAAGSGAAQPTIDVEAPPALEQFRLLLGEPGAH